MLAVILAVAALLAGGSAVDAQQVMLAGAGATFPYPLYARWAAAYAAQRGVRITYQPIGSAGGIQQFVAGAVDFGATDALPTAAQLAQASGQVLFIPTVAGAVVPVYNLREQGPDTQTTPQTEATPGKVIGPGLAFTGAVLADIFLGKIKMWDDRRIAEANPQVKLPSRPITVIHRSDDSGTTAIWTNYLSKTSREWKDRVGEGSAPKWPTGKEARGNQGVADAVRQTPNSLGYVQLAYAVAARMTFGSVRNRAGQLLAPSLSTTTKALEASLPVIPDDYLAMITNPDGADVYPIVGLTYLLAYNDQSDPDKGRALAQFLWWATHEGQRHAPALLYAPLPRSLVVRIERTLKGMTINGLPALP